MSICFINTVLPIIGTHMIWSYCNSTLKMNYTAKIIFYTSITIHTK